MDKTVEAYNKIAEEYDKSHSETIWMDELKRFRDIVPGKNILEIACGTGRDAKILVDWGFEYTGIDASEKMLAIASKRVKNGKFLTKNFYDLSFPKETFDGFLAMGALLHAPKKDVANILQLIRSALKPNGSGLIAIKQKRNLADGFIVQKETGVERYFAFYTMGEFENILKQNQFEVINNYAKKEDADNNWLVFFVKRI